MSNIAQMSDAQLMAIVNKPKQAQPVQQAAPQIAQMSDEQLMAIAKPQEAPKQPSILSRMGTQFLAGQEKSERELTELLGGQEQVAEPRIDAGAPSGFLEKGAQLAGEYLAPQPILMGLPGAGKAAQPAIEAGGRLAGKAIKPVAKLAGKGAKALGKQVSKFKAMQNIGKALKVGGKGAKEIGAFSGSAATGMPQKSYKAALDDPSLLKGKWDPAIWNKLGKKAQNAMNWLEKETGKAVGQEKDIIRKATKFAETKKFTSQIDDLMKQSKFGKIQTLNKSDIKNINELKGLLKSAKTLEELQGVKEIAQGMTKFGSETVKKSSTRGQAIIKQVTSSIKDDIAEAAPKLKEANKKFADIKNLKDLLKTELKDKSVARNLRNLVKKEDSDYVVGLFKELSDKAPNKYKFINTLKKVSARSDFERFMPGTAGGSGSPAGAGNIVRAGAIYAGTPLLAPLISPMAHKGAIKGIAGAPKAIPKWLLKTAQKIPAQTKQRLAVKAALKAKKKGEE